MSISGRFFHTFTWYYKDKLEMQPFFSIHYDVDTAGDTERIHETERMQIKYLTNDVLL